METRRKKQTQRQKKLFTMTSRGLVTVNSILQSLPSNYFKDLSMVQHRACSTSTSCHACFARNLLPSVPSTLIGLWRRRPPFGRFFYVGYSTSPLPSSRPRKVEVGWSVGWSVGKRRPKVNLSFDAVGSNSADWLTLFELRLTFGAEY
jgi:hypothetical protein